MWVESKGLGKGATFHFTLTLPTISCGISAESLHDVVFTQSDVGGGDSVMKLRSLLNQTGTSLHQVLGKESAGEFGTAAESCKILILLDNCTTQRVIEQHLESVRYTVTVTHSKEEALEVLNQGVDAIISDFVMAGQLKSYLEVESKGRGGGEGGDMPPLILLAPQVEWESEKAMELKEVYPCTRFLKTPLRQLKLVHELKTVLSPFFVKRAAAAAAGGGEGEGEGRGETGERVPLKEDNTTKKKKDSCEHTEEEQKREEHRPSVCTDPIDKQPSAVVVDSDSTTAQSVPARPCVHNPEAVQQNQKGNDNSNNTSNKVKSEEEVKKKSEQTEKPQSPVEPNGPLVLVVEDNLLNQKVKKGRSVCVCVCCVCWRKGQMRHQLVIEIISLPVCVLCCGRCWCGCYRRQAIVAPQPKMVLSLWTPSAHRPSMPSSWYSDFNALCKHSLFVSRHTNTHTHRTYKCQ